MVRHFLSTTLILILTLFITTDIPAEIDSVLTLVPEDAIGFVYIPSLLGLNDEVNTLLTELVPVDPPQEIIAKSLAGTFGARFETLEELEEIGFDLRKDFAVFLTDMNPPIPSAVVHLKDADMVKQLIETEAEGSQVVIYKDMTYHTTGEEGAFVLLEDVMVYSNTPKICEKAIDTYKKVEDSIVTNADYASLKLDMTSGTNDLVGYLVMEPLVEIIRRRLTEAVDEMKAVMEAEAEGETDPQLAEGLRMFPKLVNPKLVNRVISLLNQSKTLSLSFQLNGSELQISPFLKFKSDSEVQRYISQSPTELTQLNNLPQTAFLNGGMRVQSKDMIRLTIGMMKLFTPSDPNVDGEQIKKASQEFTKTVTAFYKFVGDEVSFSVNFSGSLVPDISLVYDASDEKKAKAYMDEEFLAYLKAGQSFYQAMGAEEYSGMYEGASARPAEMYDGVEIKSYALPSMGSAVAQLAPEMQGLVPEQWNLYYAIKGGKLIHSMSANAGPIKDVLDLIGVAGAGFDKGAGYDKLTDALTLKNNMLIAISPIAAVKNIIQLVAQTDPNIGPLMTLLGNIPEAYSIGIASQNRDGGVEGKLFISLGDFKELY